MPSSAETKRDRDAVVADLEKVRRHARILVEIGRLVAGVGALNRFLDNVVVQIARAVEIDHVKILQYRRATADLLVIAGMGWRDGVVGTATLPADMTSAPGRAFQTAQPVSIADLDAQHEFVRSPMLKEHGIVALCNVPLMIDGAAWGVVEVDSTTRCDFTEDTTDFLMAAGALIGAVIRQQQAAPSELMRIAAAAAEAQSRDVLLREMQHRVKNNFQVILSSVSQQKRRHPSPAAQQALDAIAGRISAISLAHDQLEPRRDGQVVKLSDYIRALCSTIRQQCEGIEFDVTCDELELTIERAVTLGLVLNELAINSIKHAFGGQNGQISVRLEGGIGYGEARLTVADNGRGMDAAAHEGLGLKLIASLAKQIGGSVQRDSSPRGTVTAVRFPLIA